MDEDKYKEKEGERVSFLCVAVCVFVYFVGSLMSLVGGWHLVVCLSTKVKMVGGGLVGVSAVVKVGRVSDRQGTRVEILNKPSVTWK